MLPVWITDSVTPDITRAVRYTLLWGLEGVVLRTVGGRGERVPFINETKAFRRLREAELPIAALDPGLFEGPAEAPGWRNDIAAMPELAAFARRAGCRLILTGALPGDTDAAVAAFAQAAVAAQRGGVTLALRNEGEGRATAAELAAVLAAAGHLQAAWDPAASMEAGEDPLQGLEALEGRVALVLVRDGVLEDGAWEDRVPGEGAVGWEALLRRLAERGWDGPLCLDVRGGAAAGLRSATALIHLIRAAQRS